MNHCSSTMLYSVFTSSSSFNMKIQTQFNVQLTDHYLQADYLASDHQFAALQTQDGLAMLFHLDVEGRLYATVETVATQIGWRRYSLWGGENTGTQGKCLDFAVGQDTQSGAISLAVVVAGTDGDRLFVSTGNSARQTDWLAQPEWRICPYRAEGGGDKHVARKIAKVFLHELEKNEFLVVDTVKNPDLAESDWTIERYFVDLNVDDAPVWERVEIGQYSTGRYHSHTGRRRSDEIGGLYTMGYIGNERLPQLLYQPFEDVEDDDFSEQAPPVRLRLPDDGVRPLVTAAARTSRRTTDLYCMGNNGQLYHFAATAQWDLAEGKPLISSSYFAGTEQLFVSSNSALVTVWGRNHAREIFYTFCEADKVDNPMAWSEVQLAATNVDQLSPYLNRSNDRCLQFFFSSGNDFSRITFTTDNRIKQTQKITVALPEGEVRLVPRQAYRTDISCLGEDQRPLPGQHLSLSCDRRQGVYINNAYYVLDRDPVTIPANQYGMLSVVELTDNLYGTALKVRTATDAECLTVDPTTAATNKLLTLDTADKLRKATFVDREGKTQRLLPAGTSDQELEELASYNRHLAQIQTDLLQPVSERGLPAAPMVLERGMDEWQIDFGDLLSKAKAGYELVLKEVRRIGDAAWTFIVEVAGKVYRAVIDGLDKIAGVLEWLYEKVKVGLDKIAQFVKEIANISKGVDAFIFCHCDTQVVLTIGSERKTYTRGLHRTAADIHVRDLVQGMHNEVKVEVKGHTLSGRVDPFTGLLFSTDFSHNLRMPSIIKDDYVINYGFYDAGPGYLGMSARNQFYVHVTPNHSNWIGALLKQYRGRFTVGDLVLPSSHDSGMYLDLPLSVDLTARGFVFTSGQMVSSLLAFIPVVNLLAPIVSMLSTTAALLLSPRRISRNMGVTQKESIGRQLELGVRSFDVRPGYNFLHDATTLFSLIQQELGHLVIDFGKGLIKQDRAETTVKKRIFGALEKVDFTDFPITHLHGVIPGDSLANMVKETVDFLNNHPDEVVLFAICSDGIGFVGEVKKKLNPTYKTIHSIIQENLAHGIKTVNVIRESKNKNPDYETGVSPDEEKFQIPSDYHSWHDFNAVSIDDLVKQNKRLIVGYDIEYTPNGYRRYSSYSGANDKDDPIAIFNVMKKIVELTDNPPANLPLAIATLTAQATITNNVFNEELPKAYTQLIGLLGSLTDAGNWLMSTKAKMDFTMYQQLDELLVKQGRGDGTFIMSNDFVDPSLVKLGADATEKRLRDKTENP